MAEIADANVTPVPLSWTNSKPGRVFVIILTAVACAWTIHNWLLNVDGLSNDPSCYVNAAENLVRTGKLFNYGNWPSHSPAPVVEPYTEWPPGTPFFLVPFILVFRNTMLAVVVAQSLLIFLAYAALMAMAAVLDLNTLLTVALIAFFSFLGPFRYVNTQYGSETLFFVLSLGVGVCVLKMIREGFSNKHWILSLIFTFLASSVRFTGVANIGWYLPLLGPMLVLRRSSDDPTTRLIRRILLVAGILILAGSVCVDAIGFFVSFRIHLLHFVLLIAGCTALILGLGFIPGIESRSHLVEKDATVRRDSHINLMRVFAVAAAFAPAAIWLARNKILYGFTTRSHEFFTGFNPQGVIEAPLMLCFYMLQDPIIHQTIVFVFLMLLAFTPLMIGGSKERAIGLTLLSATLLQVVTMWGSSLVATFDYLGGRLLSPAMLLAALSFLYGLGVLYRANVRNKLRLLLLVLPFLLLATNVHADFSSPDPFLWKVNYPKEMYLWKEIHKMKWTLSSTQVYTDIDYKHQIFSGILTKMFGYRGMMREPFLLKKLFSQGRRPFLVFPENSPENDMIRETIRRCNFPVDSVVYPTLGYVLYYQPPSED